MSKLLDTLRGNASQCEKRKKITVIAIYATLAVIICLMIVALVAHFVPNAKNDRNKDKEGTSEPKTVTKTLKPADIHSGNLILVNKNNEYNFAGDSALVSPTVKGSYTYDSTVKANKTALSAFDKMMADLYKNVKDADVTLKSSYRTKEYQDNLHNGTPGGCSDFHTGLSFDLREKEAEINKTSGKYDWLYQNAHKYGFIVRYPNAKSAQTGVDDYECVFRYVGVAHASYIKENSLCLEEYLNLLKTSHTESSPLTVNAADGRTYQIYYLPSSADGNTVITHSSSKSYDISGDNMNGYIVTVR